MISNNVTKLKKAKATLFQGVIAKLGKRRRRRKRRRKGEREEGRHGEHVMTVKCMDVLMDNTCGLMN